MSKEEWTPNESDKNWLRELLRWIKDGGIWDTSFATYRIDQRCKTLVLVGAGVPFIDDSEWPTEINQERVRKVAEAIGWRVLPE